MKKSNIQKKNKKILVFISNGLGEIEFILPYLYCIDIKNLNIRFGYLYSSYYYKAKKDALWSLLIDNPNYSKFFLNERDINTERDNVLKRFIRYIFNIYYVIKLFFEIYQADIILIDYGQIRVRFCILAKYIAKILGKKILAMPHTSNPDYLFKMSEIPSSKLKNSLKINMPRDDETVISLDRLSFSYNFYFLGFKNQQFVGNPKKNYKFLNLVKSIKPEYSDFILYCSFYEHKLTFNKESKKKHIINAYRVLRKYYPNKKIVYTLHPREKRKELEEIFQQNKFLNVEISITNSFVLCKDALLTIGNLTAATHCSLYFGLNSINYWEDVDTYLPAAGHSIQFDYLNNKHAKNVKELDLFVKQHINGEDFVPDIFKLRDDNIKNIFRN